MDVLVLLGSFTLLCALGVPVAYALGLGAIIAALYVDIPLEAVMLKISDGTDDFALLAIPFFVLAGAIMAEGGMATRLINVAKVFVGFIRGGMAVVNVLASTLFGCISGSSVADTSAIGSVMIPQMVKQGYPRVFATNVTICGSVQALMIPPSHNAVIYSLAAGGTISVASLFLAGILPALLFGFCLIGLVLLDLAQAPVPRLGARAAEGGAEDRAGRLLGPDHGVHHHGRHPLGRLHRHRIGGGGLRVRLPRHLPRLPRLQMARPAAPVHRVVKTVAMVMMLIGFSVGFGYMMAIMQIPAKVTMFFLGISENKYVFLLLVNILLLLLGTFMDLAPMLLICTPIFMPVILKLGIDPVHFGIVMILNLGIGLITPPVRADPVRRLRGRQGHHGTGIEGIVAVLRRHVPRAAAGDVYSRPLPVDSRTDEMSSQDWQPSARYPDPAMVVVDESFNRYRLPLAKVERLATGLTRWAEGPVWLGDTRSLVWSDVPGNCMWRWDEEAAR